MSRERGAWQGIHASDSSRNAIAKKKEYNALAFFLVKILWGELRPLGRKRGKAPAGAVRDGARDTRLFFAANLRHILGMETAPDLEQIETLARQAMAALPPQFARGAAEIALCVADFAPERMLSDLGIADPFELTGLYDGIPLTEKSVMDQPMGPDTIWLFRRPIFDEWCARGTVTLAELVSHVTIHELAHHFGWSDDDIAVIDRWWE